MREGWVILGAVVGAFIAARVFARTGTVAVTLSPGAPIPAGAAAGMSVILGAPTAEEIVRNVETGLGVLRPVCRTIPPPPGYTGVPAVVCS
jgi:hypothetical protein